MPFAIFVVAVAALLLALLLFAAPVLAIGFNGAIFRLQLLLQHLVSVQHEHPCHGALSAFCPSVLREMWKGDMRRGADAGEGHDHEPVCVANGGDREILRKAMGVGGERGAMSEGL